MTRPRIAGSVESCIRLIVELVKVRTDTPMTTSATPNSQTLGMIAAKAKPIPKDRGAASRSPKRGFSRPAASSAPATVPIAMIDVRNPYWLRRRERP